MPAFGKRKYFEGSPYLSLLGGRHVAVPGGIGVCCDGAEKVIPLLNTRIFVEECLFQAEPVQGIHC